MKKIKGSFFLMLFVAIYSCSQDETTLNTQVLTASDCVSLNGLGNLYPLAENPRFTTVSNTNLDDESLVSIINFGDEIRVYPYDYTFRHEVINDSYNGIKFAFTYCPLTKSAVAFKTETNFRASGYLLNDNLIPWDEKTQSFWSQMLGKGLECSGNESVLATIQVVETKWSTVKSYFSDAKVLTDDFVKKSGIKSENERYSIISPEIGEQVFGIVTNIIKPGSSPEVSILRYSDFKTLSRFNISVLSKNYIICGNEEKRIINAFNVANIDAYDTLDTTQFPYVLEDKKGVKYTILGIGTDGSQLPKAKFSYVALWGAWKRFYNDFTFL
jgi:hypothetical protein